MNTPAANRIRNGRLRAEEGTRKNMGGQGVRLAPRRAAAPPSGRRARVHRETIVLGGVRLA